MPPPEDELLLPPLLLVLLPLEEPPDELPDDDPLPPELEPLNPPLLPPLELPQPVDAVPEKAARPRKDEARHAMIIWRRMGGPFVLGISTPYTIPNRAPAGEWALPASTTRKCRGRIRSGAAPFTRRCVATRRQAPTSPRKRTPPGVRCCRACNFPRGALREEPCTVAA